MTESRLELRLSARASKALALRHTPLEVEMELFFSCLIRKRVHFMKARHPNALDVPLADAKLLVSFRPVVTKVCMISDVIDDPDLEDLSISRAEIFTPKWLSLDLKNGSWVGDFGWVSDGRL